MIHLIQIMTHLLKNLEYSVKEVAEMFAGIEEGEYTIEEVVEAANLEPLTADQKTRVMNKLHDWESALTVVCGQLGIETDESRWMEKEKDEVIRLPVGNQSRLDK